MIWRHQFHKINFMSKIILSILFSWLCTSFMNCPMIWQQNLHGHEPIKRPNFGHNIMNISKRGNLWSKMGVEWKFSIHTVDSIEELDCAGAAMIWVIRTSETINWKLGGLPLLNAAYFLKRLRPHTVYATGSPIKAGSGDRAIVVRIYWIVIVSMGVSAFSYLTSSAAELSKLVKNNREEDLPSIINLRLNVSNYGHYQTSSLSLSFENWILWIFKEKIQIQNCRFYESTVTVCTLKYFFKTLTGRSLSALGFLQIYHKKRAQQRKF